MSERAPAGRRPHTTRATSAAGAAGVVLAAVAALASSPARAQVGFGQPGGPPPAATSAPAGPPTHAASGADDAAKLPTQEPMLPPDPLAIPPKVSRRIGTDAERDPEKGRGAETERRFYGPWYEEKSDKYRFRTLFPLWAERLQPGDRASFFAPLYFQRRSTQYDADVAFPLFWRLRDGATRTTVVGPFMHREAEPMPAKRNETTGLVDPARPGRHDNWLAPLFFEGKTTDGGGYLHVPPLLAFTQHTARSGFDIVGPLFCKWKGGSACDTRTADDIDLGIAPLYFYGRDDRTEYEVVPPLLHFYRYRDVGDASFNLWGPFLWESSREGGVFDILPIWWRNWGKNEDHMTLFPLFHYGYKGTSNLLVTPLFMSSRGEHDERAFVTWGFARYRGRTELDMWSPLFWWYRDPDIGLDRKILVPFLYRNTSPRSDDLAVFPLFAHFDKPAISETWFITPFFRHTRNLTGWETDIYPLFYFGRENRSTHLVLAPLIWDFASPRSRQTVLLPAYFRFADETTVSQLALNTYYREKRVPGGTEWELHVFPVFSYGQSPTGHWWNVLYGMAGFTREGSMTKMRAAFIPIQLSD